MNNPSRRSRSLTLAFLLVFYVAQVALWIFLLFYVPALVRSLADTGTALPVFTRWVINVSEFSRRTFFIVAPLSVLAYVGLGLLVGYRGRELWARILFGIMAALSLLHLAVLYLCTQLPRMQVP